METNKIIEQVTYVIGLVQSHPDLTQWQKDVIIGLMKQSLYFLNH